MSNKVKILLAVIGVLIVVGAGPELLKMISSTTSDTSSHQSSESTSEPNSESEMQPHPQGSGKTTELENTKEVVDFVRNEANKFQLNGELLLQNSRTPVGTARATIGKKFTIDFTKNWYLNLDGTKISAVHTTGPTLKIQQAMLVDKFVIEDVTNTINNFLTQNYVSDIQVTDIFFSDKVIGKMGQGNIVFDNKSYFMNAGIFLLDKEVYHIILVYPPETEEIVLSILNTIKFGDKQVVLK